LSVVNGLYGLRCYKWRY